MTYYKDIECLGRTTNKFFYYGYEDPFASFRYKLLEYNGRKAALSKIMEERTFEFMNRTSNVLLRPVYINGVELGFSLPTTEGDTAMDIMCRNNRLVRVRAITNTLWFFISRGHMAQALVPYCFQKFPDKSDNHDELMLLHKLRLVEFVSSGYGEEKYVEVNRILAKRARDKGSCIVARSRLQTIVAEMPYMEAFLANRVLIPTFNGCDIMFPVDGPLGRAGQDLQASLICREVDVDEDEYTEVKNLQLTLKEQCYIMETISDFIDKPQWIELGRKLMRDLPQDERDFEVFTLPLRPTGIGFLTFDNPNLEPMGECVAGMRVHMGFDINTGKFWWRYTPDNIELMTATDAEWTDPEDGISYRRNRRRRRYKHHFDPDEHVEWGDSSSPVSEYEQGIVNRLRMDREKRRQRYIRAQRRRPKVPEDTPPCSDCDLC